MEACLVDSLVSEISPSYYFLIKIIIYTVWTSGLAWLVRSHLNEMRSQYRDENRHISTHKWAGPVVGMKFKIAI